MIITKEWIHANKTINGSWSRKQVVALGVDWPPTKGWQRRLVGTEITEAQQYSFEHKGAIPNRYNHLPSHQPVSDINWLSDRITALENQLAELEVLVR